jgi:phosphopantothenoylcysteine decarboxylase/phosphopantothenate--cysteine ligase
MLQAVLAHLENCSVVIKAAAVSDYRPRVISPKKLKKGGPEASLELERTKDILAEIGKSKGRRILVGFAAETEDLVANARMKLSEKNLDLIVANDVMSSSAGFGVDTNQVKILSTSGEIKNLPLMTKEEVANSILDEVVNLLKRRKG